MTLLRPFAWLPLVALLGAPGAARADASKETPAGARKLAREWQVDSRLFVAEKDAPELRKGGASAARRPAPKLDK